MRVMKFGGSSVATPERIQQVIGIVAERAVQPVAVVVSAFGGVTDELIAMGHKASRGEMDYLDTLKNVKERHYTIAEALIPAKRMESVNAHLEKEFKELTDALQGIALIRELTKRTLDLLMSFGERLSAYIIAAAMQEKVKNAIFVDARGLITTDRHFGSGHVNYDHTYPNIHSKLGDGKSTPIITGFIASTPTGETTTLGRGGSDFTAAIVGAALKADEIEIWTDVDGVMTADPRKVKQAFPIARMTYKEALEMSHFGAKVIHPPTIAPALQRNIPIRIKNTLNPSSEGTLITSESCDHEHPISGISSIDEVALFRVEGSGIVGVCGVASRLFGALARKEISVILISQGSSEHSICFAIAPQGADFALEVLEEEFALEMQAGLIDEIMVEKEVSIVAVVGENMRKTPGIAGRLFGALGRNGVNIITVAQGSSEFNISMVISKADEIKALNVIHEAFFLSQVKTLNLFLCGTGLIGKTLLGLIQKQNSNLQKDYSLNLNLIGIANSSHMVFDPKGISIESYDARLHGSNEKMHVAGFVKRMRECNLSNSIFVDCTSSQEVADVYATVLDNSISIVTPNKKANSGPYSTYKQLKALSMKRGVKFLYETNVGAGLPIIGTVIDLIRSGDKIRKIEAILSGTLSYLFNTFMTSPNLSFSEVLREAQKKGFTEPDPRDDLNGMDVMRKLLILIRESGYPFELDQIALEPLLPQECFDADSVDAFYKKLEGHNAAFDARRKAALKAEKTLRFVASFENEKAKVGLQEVDAKHPFYHLSGSDNIIAFTTERYRDNPLVIKGQGAGAEVTAGEVLADIIRIGAI